MKHLELNLRTLVHHKQSVFPLYVLWHRLFQPTLSLDIQKRLKRPGESWKVHFLRCKILKDKVALYSKCCVLCHQGCQEMIKSYHFMMWWNAFLLPAYLWNHGMAEFLAKTIKDRLLQAMEWNAIIRPHYYCSYNGCMWRISRET